MAVDIYVAETLIRLSLSPPAMFRKMAGLDFVLRTYEDHRRNTPSASPAPLTKYVEQILQLPAPQFSGDLELPDGATFVRKA